jgi:hypothetical protein
MPPLFLEKIIIGFISLLHEKDTSADAPGTAPGSSKAAGRSNDRRPQLPRSGSIWRAEISATVSHTKERQKLSLVSRALMLLQGKPHDEHRKDGLSKSSKKSTVSLE